MTPGLAGNRESTHGLHKCRKPDCRRLVSAGSLYCCGPCATADEGGWELGSWVPGCDNVNHHSQSCEQHSAQRGTWRPGAYGDY